MIDLIEIFLLEPQSLGKYFRVNIDEIKMEKLYLRAKYKELKSLPLTQDPELQVWFLTISPEQFAPPFLGLGSEHSLRLN